MIGELGQLSLCLALVLSLVQAVAGFAGAAHDSPRIIASARSAALGAFVFIALAMGALIAAYVTSDFSVLAVAENSHTAKPLLYKITGAWGNHEGSMLLWLFILGLYSAAVAAAGVGGPKMTARALAVQALVAVAFLVFVLFTSDPFQRLDPPPFEGAGLNPLLQDPGLAFHPPLLYLGYVGLSATFAYAAAALLAKDNDAAWVRAARPFALAAWVTLTLGVALGAWWAYYELGWGGFWFWDPTENAALMPWLIATALIHSMMATQKTGAFKSWTLLLAIAAFAFSLIGTFLVRSGVLTSVHAFANDPERGVFILAILVVAIGAPLALFAWRAPKLTPGAPFEPASRETAILVNNLLLAVAAATVFVGTLYPLLLEALEGARISVGPPYFTLTFLPVMALLAVCVPFGPTLSWRNGDLKASVRTLRVAAIATLAAGGLTLAIAAPADALGAGAIALGVWLIVGAACDLRRRAGAWRRIAQLGASGWSSAVAHAGLGVVALGVAGATVWKSEAIDVLAPGATMNIAGYTLRLDSVSRVLGPNYFADRGNIAVLVDGREIARLHPEKRAYPVEGQATTESAIRTTGFSDLYVVLGDARDPRVPGTRSTNCAQGAPGHWVVRAYVNPLAPFIWIGAGIMALGGGLAFRARLQRRRASKPTPAMATS